MAAFSDAEPEGARGASSGPFSLFRVFRGLVRRRHAARVDLDADRLVDVVYRDHQAVLVLRDADQEPLHALHRPPLDADAVADLEVRVSFGVEDLLESRPQGLDLLRR